LRDGGISQPRISELKAGNHIHHTRFGEGVVISCLATNNDHEVTVAFRGEVGIKKLLLSLAPLEKM
jgi:DNA helicase-2/ATP-dependent DNA helicase PcrA